MADDPSAFTLVEERIVRERLRGRALQLRLLAPPFPSLGVGALRVLRLKEVDGVTELVAGYERYERITE